MTTSISIVIPSLNQGQYIEKCLKSIIDQRYPNLQIIVVDGQSSDETPDVLSRYEDQLSEVIIEADHGQSDALAKGFALAKGDIQCYLNTDDFLLPGALARVSALFSKWPHVDMIYSNRLTVNEHDELIDCWMLPSHSRYLMERWDYIPQETCFWRKTLYSRTDGIDTTLDFCMDYDLFIKFMRTGRVIHIADFLAVFRRHGKSKTTLLNESLGKREVALLQRRHNISMHAHDRAVGSLLRRFIEYRSKRYLMRRRQALNEKYAFG